MIKCILEGKMKRIFIFQRNPVGKRKRSNPCGAFSGEKKKGGQILVGFNQKKLTLQER